MCLCAGVCHPSLVLALIVLFVVVVVDFVSGGGGKVGLWVSRFVCLCVVMDLFHALRYYVVHYQLRSKRQILKSHDLRNSPHNSLLITFLVASLLHTFTATESLYVKWSLRCVKVGHGKLVGNCFCVTDISSDFKEMSQEGRARNMGCKKLVRNRCV